MHLQCATLYIFVSSAKNEYFREKEKMKEREIFWDTIENLAMQNPLVEQYSWPLNRDLQLSSLLEEDDFNLDMEPQKVANEVSLNALTHYKCNKYSINQ